MCPAWKHGLELEQKKPVEYKEDDGLKYVDHYASIYHTIQALEKELELVKENIIHFAQSKDISVVYGTKEKASLTSYKKIHYPKTEEFITLLKEKGVYEKLISLNAVKMKNILRRQGFDQEILEQLELSPGWSLRLMKKKVEK